MCIFCESPNEKAEIKNFLKEKIIGAHLRMTSDPECLKFLIENCPEGEVNKDELTNKLESVLPEMNRRFPPSEVTKSVYLLALCLGLGLSHPLFVTGVAPSPKLTSQNLVAIVFGKPPELSEEKVKLN
tara:strand:+ start:6388 stop:6771 length:384 start_codon:yes stop_codon:yes gene_type:complete